MTLRKNENDEYLKLKFGQSAEDLDKSYEMITNLWTGYISHYHTLSQAYLLANSILVAAIAVTLGKDVCFLIPTLFSLAGLVVCIQMYVALGRLRSEKAYWERCLRIIEAEQNYKCNIFKILHKFRECKETLPEQGEEPKFKPYVAIRVHRKWWAERMRLLPILFGFMYFVILWTLIQPYSGETALTALALAIIIPVLSAICESSLKCKKQPKQNEQARMRLTLFFGLVYLVILAILILIQRIKVTAWLVIAILLSALAICSLATLLAIYLCDCMLVREEEM